MESSSLLVILVLFPRTWAYDNFFLLVTRMSADFCLSACNDTGVFMDPCNPSSKNHIWNRVEYVNFVDETGRSAFMLTNVATENSLHHGFAENEQVDSAAVTMSNISDAFLWTTSPDLGEGYSTIRSYENVVLNLDVDHADWKDGGVKRHNRLILHSWNEGSNQLWRMIPAGGCGCGQGFT